jgi:catechol 2,3-dioxygenase
MRFHENNVPHFVEVTLQVKNLKRTIDFYQSRIGLEVIDQNDKKAVLGYLGSPLVQLEEVDQSSSNKIGLYHVAFLLPTMTDLADWVLLQQKNNWLDIGAGDHIVSKAFYISDPDGNGIEVYADTDENTWRRPNGDIYMTTKYLNLEELIQHKSKGFMPETIKIGHIHLKGADIPSFANFYQSLGMDVIQQLPGAMFMSFNGYHHHVAMNTWGNNGGAYEDGLLGIKDYTLQVPSDMFGTMKQEFLGKTFDETNQMFHIKDPLGITLKIKRREV